MKYLFIIFFCYLVICHITLSNGRHCRHKKHRRDIDVKDEKSVHKFLCTEYEEQASNMCTKAVTAEWNHLVDIKDKTKAKLTVNATIESARLDKLYWKTYFREMEPDTFNDRNLARQVKLLSILGNAALSEEKLKELSSVLNEMTRIYSTSKICPYKNPHCNLSTEGLSLDPDLEKIMAHSRDYDELLYTWISWREATGVKIKRLYEYYVMLSNEAAQANNFTDKGAMWRNEYETLSLESDLDRLWDEVSPLYNELHSYVLHRLKHVYGKEIGLDDDELIPAHLLGNMWGQTWTNLRTLVKPFPEAEDVDVTAALKKQNFTALKMFKVANEFYTSIGLESMEMAYNTSLGAIIEKPKNKEILCHASAWDFCDGKDFRIKMCTEVNYQNFITIHHEMGHIQYYIQYSHLPIIYRAGANPGFHEAIGDTIALSVSTPKHLKKIGLIPNTTESMKSTINALMDMALERVAFLPFGLLIDKWRWDIFAEKVAPEQWNTHYWNYREKYQKLKAPIPRPHDAFDGGSKYHIPGDAQYISYFFAHILEFQLHKALCKQSGRYVPDDPDMALHNCDIYSCTAAGNQLREGLRLGASKHWKFVLQVITGERELSGSALMEYFKPLYEFLVYENDQYDKCKK